MTNSDSDWPRWRLPFLAADLVGDELVGGVVVGDAQQRLGKAHQHHALFGGKRIFLHEGIDAALLLAPGPDRGDKLARQFMGLPAFLGREPRLMRQLAHQHGFVRKELVFDGGAARQFWHETDPAGLC